MNHLGKFVVTAAAGLACAFSAASAADLPIKADRYQPPPAGFNWSGIYVFGEAGYAWGANDPLNIAGQSGIPAFVDLTNPGSLGANAAGGVGGLGLAFRMQPGGSPFVFGAHVAGDITGLNANTNPDTITSLLSLGATGTSLPNAKVTLPWDVRFFGELGYAVLPNLLIGGQGGGVCGEIKTAATASTINMTTGTLTTAAANADNVHCGWGAGLFAYYALSPNIVLGLNWIYSDLGHQGITLQGQGFTSASFVVDDTAKYNKVMGSLSIKFP